MSDRPTPLTDAAWRSCMFEHEAWEFTRDLERKLALAREALEWAQSQLGKHTRPSPIDKALASINGKGTT